MACHCNYWPFAELIKGEEYHVMIIPKQKLLVSIQSLEKSSYINPHVHLIFFIPVQVHLVFLLTSAMMFFFLWKNGVFC
jgi:hypothetical protein